MIDHIKGATLIDFNVGCAGAVLLLNPMAAQIDALLALGLGPFQTALAAQFNAALSAQATLSLQISLGDIGLLVALQASIRALVALQASMALGLPIPSLSLGAELGASVALMATLQVLLGGVRLLIEAALAVKIPAIRAAAALAAALSAGPFFGISFGMTLPQSTLAAQGAEFASLFATGLVDGTNVIDPGDPVFGVMLICKVPTLQTALQAIITVP